MQYSFIKNWYILEGSVTDWNLICLFEILESAEKLCMILYFNYHILFEIPNYLESTKIRTVFYFVTDPSYILYSDENFLTANFPQTTV